MTAVYYMAISTFLINTCVQAALLLIGTSLIEHGKLTPEVLLAFMLYQGQLQVLSKVPSTRLLPHVELIFWLTPLALYRMKP
jgi:ABC-type multidrug transport system fused ATPase/permease subunit